MNVALAIIAGFLVVAVAPALAVNFAVTLGVSAIAPSKPSDTSTGRFSAPPRGRESKFEPFRGL